MWAGVNSSGLTGSIPQTASQAAASSPAVAPVKPYGVCQDCLSKKMVMDRQVAEIGTLNDKLTSAQADLAQMGQRLDASSGVTMTGRQAETILRLQKLEETQRVANDHLEQENTLLRALCAKNKINIEAALTPLERRA